MKGNSEKYTTYTQYNKKYEISQKKRSRKIENENGKKIETKNVLIGCSFSYHSLIHFADVVAIFC